MFSRESSWKPNNTKESRITIKHCSLWNPLDHRDNKHPAAYKNHLQLTAYLSLWVLMAPCSFLRSLATPSCSKWLRVDYTARLIPLLQLRLNSDIPHRVNPWQSAGTKGLQQLPLLQLLGWLWEPDPILRRLQYYTAHRWRQTETTTCPANCPGHCATTDDFTESIHADSKRSWSQSLLVRSRECVASSHSGFRSTSAFN